MLIKQRFNGEEWIPENERSYLQMEAWQSWDRWHLADVSLTTRLLSYYLFRSQFQLQPEEAGAGGYSAPPAAQDKYDGTSARLD